MAYSKSIETTMIEALSGLAEYKDGTNEIWVDSGCVKKHMTIEITDADAGMFILRAYYKSGKKRFEAEYVKQVRCGRYRHWNRAGQITMAGKYFRGIKSGWWDYPLSNYKLYYYKGRDHAIKYTKFKIFKNGNYKELAKSKR